jgi:RNA polymerase sigma factor (sigma-70 family)
MNQHTIDDAMTGATGPNGHGQQSESGNDVLGGLSREALIRAQKLELRHRPIDLLHALTIYVNFELGRRRRMGQLAEEDLLRDEVIDSAFAAALTRLETGEPIRDLHTYLRTRAQDMIGREVRRVQFERRQHVSLEQTLSSGEGGEEGGEEVRVADIIPDRNAHGPEQIAIDNETLAYMIDTLSDVPDLWRTVFLQRTMQDRSAREVAELEGLDIDEVRRITVRTRDFLRERFEIEYEIPEE